MITERDRKLDILRCLALLGIMIAHVNPSDFVVQLRSYDVPMMAFLSGASYYLSSSKKEKSYGQYVANRFKKLVLSTWFFLTFFFIGTYILSLIKNDVYYFDCKKIVDSYTLLGGIGYVWIVWIFFSIALFNPFLLKLNRNIKNTYVYILLLLVIYMLYMGIVGIYKNIFSGNVLVFFEHYIVYAIGYILVAALGMRLYMLKKQEIVILEIVFFVIYMYMAIDKNFELTGNYKYPTQTYYLSYALALILIMYLMLYIKPLYKILDNPVIWFMSENSFWIYIWHIVPIYCMSILGLQDKGIFKYVIGRYLFVLIIAVLLTLLHNMIKYTIKNIKSQT